MKSFKTQSARIQNCNIKYLIILVLQLFFLNYHSSAQGVSINASNSPPDPSALLDLTSSSQGLLTPRMTTAEISSIVNPAEGLLIFNTTTKCFNVYKMGSWYEICGNCIPPPAPVAGNNGPVCFGSTLNLTASSVPNVTYSWTGPNGFTSTQQNPSISSVTTAQAGTYQVRTNSTTCSSAYIPTTVVVNAPPVSTFSYSPLTIMAGQSVTFTPTVTGASYNWAFTGGTPSSSTIESPSVTWSTSGTYNVSLTLTLNGCSSTTSVNVTVISCGPITGTQTYNYTGSVQTFTVPNCVTKVTIEAWGGRGGNSIQYGSPPNWDFYGGLGAYVKGDLNVTGGQTLNIYVGGQGGDATSSGGSTPICVRAGWNGGSCATEDRDGGGGGASDVRVNGTSLNDRVIVAAGGGGADQYQGNGGAGGYPNGSNGGGGSGFYGYGGTQSSGGIAGSGASAGTFGYGGAGATNYSPGAGGGWYGGGGGTDQGGGGGGSSYTGTLTNTTTQNGIWSGNGKIVISW